MTRYIKKKIWLPIESGIPIPLPAKTGRVRGSEGQAQWKNMKVGDSIFFKNAIQDRVAPLASSAGARFGWRFTCRIINGGIRVWRTA